MHLAALLFFVASSVALLTLPRRLAPLPLLLSCCYMTISQGIDLGPISLPVYRMTLAVGVVRVLIKKERLAGDANAVDWLVLAWAAWVLFASFFHAWAPGSGPVFAAGLVFNTTLVYFLMRVWCRNVDELRDLSKLVGLLLVPIAAEMTFEHIEGRNLFSILGGVDERVFLRDGAFRAQGPFGHPILAGTVGAVTFPLLLGVWRRARLLTSVGMVACLTMIVASASSGPVMSFGFGVLAVALWRWRGVTRFLVPGFVGVYLALELVMSRPPYYVISMFDMTGSSTGWYRSRLIESTIEHWSEWWLFGTDYTRHWMHVALSENHTDLTNYYILTGVIGGLPAMLLLIAILRQAFSYVGLSIRLSSVDSDADRFMLWCFGAGLFAHATTSLSVPYFDQSVVFFWLNIAIISSMYSILRAAPTAAPRTLDAAASPVPLSTPVGRLNPGWYTRRPQRPASPSIQSLN